MIKKNNYMLAAGIAILIISISIGVKCYINYSVTTALNNAKEAELTKEEYKTDSVNILKTLDSYTSEEVKEKLLGNFSFMDKADCTEVVDTYIYGTYNAAMQYTLTDEETDALMFVTASDAHQPDLSRLDDEELKEKFENLKNEEHIVIRYVNNDIFYDVDYKYFLDSFGEYLNDDYYSLLSFYEEEKNSDYVDDANEDFHADVVTDRLDKLYQMLTAYPTSDIFTSIQSSYYFYKAIYLGAYAQDYIFDSGSLRENVMESYKAYKDTCKDNTFKEFLGELVKDYEDVELTRTVPIYEKIKTFCGMQQTTETETDTDTVISE